MQSTLTTSTQTIERMADAAGQLLSVLSDELRERVCHSFSDEDERRRWFYTPNERGEQTGVPLSEMGPRQQQATHRLVASGLSGSGYTTASTIMGLENTLDWREGWRAVSDYRLDEKGVRQFADPDRNVRRRDPNRYYIVIFGEPGADAPWGWRFDGHHVVVQYTIISDRIATPTPTFFGANPAESALGGSGLLRPLADEEDLARELLHALDEEQRASAIISPAPPDDIVHTNSSIIEDDTLPRPAYLMGQGDTPETRKRQAQFRKRLGLNEERLEAIRYQAARPKGVVAATMTEAQREILRALIRQYTDRMPEAVAEAESERVLAVQDTIHFAWAGGLERRQPHYYRLQGERFLVEYDNAQNDANHVHSVWRDPEGDFGADLLARHYAEAH